MRPPGKRAGAAWIFCSLLLAAGGRAAGAAASAEDLFAKGNESYARGDYVGAAASYEAILSSGLRDSRVCYNLGNTYFKQNRIGQAILFYEKALRLDPSDADARENLRYAGLRIRDRLPEEDLPYLLGLLARLRDSVNPDRVTALFLGLYLGSMALAAGWILARGARWGLISGVGALVLIALALTAGGWMIVQAGERALADRAVVLAEKVEVVSGPGSENTLLSSIHEGTRVRIRNRRDDWVQVTLPDGRTGWMREDALGLI